jgi:hypothetical protein
MILFTLWSREQGPTVSPVYCRRDGKVDVEYYAINVVVPQKLLYKSIQQLRSVSLLSHPFFCLDAQIS